MVYYGTTVAFAEKSPFNFVGRSFLPKDKKKG
jgi:hypothetical protein